MLSHHIADMPDKVAILGVFTCRIGTFSIDEMLYTNYCFCHSKSTNITAACSILGGTALTLLVYCWPY